METDAGMNAVVITQPGGPEVLRLQRRPRPAPRSKEVLVKVAAAGVNRPDVAQRKGHYPPPPGISPDIPGMEIAGTIVEAGSECERWRPGDRVCALVAGGGYAEYCTAPEGQCMPVPGSLSYVEAASLPETYFTVWSNVFERGALKPGESLLVHGGSSGIGVAAIQLAKAFDSPVYVTAGSEEKCAFCEKLGATRAINYKTEKFDEILKAVTQDKGINVILDMIGGDYTSGNLNILAEDGRLVMINTMGGDPAPVKLGAIMRKRLTVTGSTLRGRTLEFKAALARRVEAAVWPLLSSSRIKPIVYRSFPLDQAGEAHRIMESSTHIGKLILSVSQE